ncbi:MAG TPA: hypothetical protein VFQ91_12255 [Bryobacteraceae bacterium]|nr:hypothetical protein [Bryobacteraceae bacterium]
MRSKLGLYLWLAMLTPSQLLTQAKKETAVQKIRESDIKECQNTHDGNCWQNNAINVNPRPPVNGYARFAVANQAVRFVASVDQAEPACTASKDITLYIQIGSERVYTAAFGPSREIDLDVSRLPDDDQAQSAMDVTKPPPAKFLGQPVPPGSVMTVAASGPECTVNYRNPRFLLSSR